MKLIKIDEIAKFAGSDLRGWVEVPADTAVVTIDENGSFDAWPLIPIAGHSAWFGWLGSAGFDNYPSYLGAGHRTKNWDKWYWEIPQ